MKEKLLMLTGLEKHSDYINKFFYAANMRASIYMSVYIACMEIWMIIRLLSRQLTGTDIRTEDYYVSHYLNYSLLLSVALGMLIFAVRYVRGRKCSIALGYVLKWTFMLICLFFGIDISAADYGKGEQVFTFLTMELFAACLLTWRPIISFLIISISYGIFYLRIDPVEIATTGISGSTDATKINLFIMWIATLFCSFAIYFRTVSQAKKDEQLEKLNRHLENIAEHDELTGIHNMFYFRMEAAKKLEAPEKTGLAFLFFDIENFKSYNETYGFRNGNELLNKTAVLLKSTFGDALTARMSDDHFVVLTEWEGAEEKAEKISAEIEREQNDVQLQLKCGAYRVTEKDTDPVRACDRARYACTSIKKYYGRKFREYDEKLSNAYRLHHHIVNTIDAAVRDEYIQVYYQPIVSVKDGTVIGAEALARWKDPKYGMLSPGAFIDTLEEHRQIHKLDCFIIDRICHDIREELDAGNECPPVSVNLSRLDFELCDIVKFVCDTTDKYGLPHSLLDIEVTESVLVGGKELLKYAVEKLRDLGFKVWLDDFGSGYSSLNVLKDYKFDVLKIDMQFLEGFSDNSNAKPILENIISLTDRLDMVSLTEGVETHEQLDFLRKLGCCRAQGYLFCRPVPLVEFKEKIKSGQIEPAT